MDINKNIDRELDGLGIFELRALARQLGVKSPTTKRRSDLMDKIKSVVEGSELPEIHSRAGRPAKKMVNSEVLLSNLMAQVEEKNENAYSTIDPFSGKIVFEQNIDYDITALSNQIIAVGGILRKAARRGYFFYSCLSLNNKVYVTVPYDIVKEYKMIEGDFVFGNAHKLIGKNVAMLNSIEKVNGADVDKLDNIVSLDYILPEKYISFDSSPLLEGQFYVKEVQNTKELIKNIEYNANVLSSQGYECVCLGVELSLESKLTLDKVQNLTTIYSMFDDASVLSYETTLDAINHVRALFARGKKVVLFICNIANMYPMFDMYFSSKGSVMALEHTMETLQTIKTLIGLAKATKTASVTCFCYYEKSDLEDMGKSIKDIKRNAVEI